MAQNTCPICLGFGKVHPVICPSTRGGEPQKSEIRISKSETNPNDLNPNVQNGNRGRVDYSALVFCVCRGDKALKVAHPAVDYPFQDADVVCPRFYDGFDAEKQARYRVSPEFSEELKALSGDAAEPEEKANSPPPEDRQGLINMKKELTEFKQRLNEHLGKSKRPDWRQRI